MLNVKIGDRVRALDDAEFSWGLTVKTGDEFPILTARDVQRLRFHDSQEWFEVVAHESPTMDRTKALGLLDKVIERYDDETRDVRRKDLLGRVKETRLSISLALDEDEGAPSADTLVDLYDLLTAVNDYLEGGS
jgi:hypothetical protein